MNPALRPDILSLRFTDVEAQLALWKQPSFRARQVWEWLYAHQAADWDKMTNLPRSLREQLARFYALQPLTPIQELTSRDGLTRKILFRMADGLTIESVLMLYDQRYTVCVSSQVGCPIGCAFCATGQGGFVRNLTAGEIVAQPLHFARQLQVQGQNITHIVIMGMGEPLLNQQAVMQAVETWNDHRGFDLGARKITLSTVGYVPGIEELTRSTWQVGLAVSLHAPDDALRDQLVPLNRKYPLTTLLAACRNYTGQTGRRVTFEYALMDGINDSPDQARRLAALLQGWLCHVNLIPLNPTSGGAYRPSPTERVRTFQHVLQEQNIPVTVRLRRGLDIAAGCGQLWQRNP